MRICSPQLGLDPNSILGGEIYDYEILKGLAGKGMEIEILLPKNRPYDKTVKNWHITYLPITHIPAFLYNFLEIPYLFKIYRQRPFKILRVHVPYFTGVGALIFKLFHPKVKVIATYHQVRSGLFANLFDGIICDSQAAKDRLINKFRAESQKISVIHGGTPAYLKPIRKPHQGIVLLFMGLFIERKNPLFLIQVVNKLLKKFPRVKLIFCGDGPLKSFIKPSPNIIINPPVFGKDKQKLYSQADIFVHPAIHEGFPLVVLEALACGLPVVISNEPWAKETIIPHQNGELAKTNDIDDWVQKIEYMIKNKSKYHVTNPFTWAKATGLHARVFQSVLHSATP